MMSAMSSSDVGATKMTHLWVPKINGDSWSYVANVDISVHIRSSGIVQDFECAHGFEKSQAHAVKQGKCILYP